MGLGGTGPPPRTAMLAQRGRGKPAFVTTLYWDRPHAAGMLKKDRKLGARVLLLSPDITSISLPFSFQIPLWLVCFDKMLGNPTGVHHEPSAGREKAEQPRVTGTTGF